MCVYMKADMSTAGDADAVYTYMYICTHTCVLA